MALRSLACRSPAMRLRVAAAGLWLYKSGLGDLGVASQMHGASFSVGFGARMRAGMLFCSCQNILIRLSMITPLSDSSAEISTMS